MAKPNEKRGRSPSVPFIPLGNAISRAREVYDRIGGQWITVADAALAWGLGAKSSATLQTISALRAYGLIETGRFDRERRIRLSEMVLQRLFGTDSSRDPEEEQKALVTAALTPKLIAECAERWQYARPRDADAISDLKLRYKFTDDAAVRFLRVFDEAIWFARSGANPGSDLESGGTRSALAVVPASRIIVGDYVHWRAGDDEFVTPRKVVWLSDGALYLSVEGTRTRFATSEVKLVPPPAGGAAARRLRFGDFDGRQELNDPSVVVRGSRLEIRGLLDIAGVQTLRRALPHYRAAILTSSSPEPDKPPNPDREVEEIPRRRQDAAEGLEEDPAKPFPVQGLQWADQHAYWLYAQAGIKDVSLDEAAEIWREFGLKPYSSAFFDTIDGLIEFGFVEQSGTGKARKIRLTTLGWTIFRRPDDKQAQQAFYTAASKPKLLASYAEAWGKQRPQDAACIAQLVQEQGFTEALAKNFLRVFDEVSSFIMKRNQTAEIPEPSRSQPPSQFTALLSENRLMIAADLDVTGVDTLGETLSSYEKLLQLWAPFWASGSEPS